MPKTKTTPKTQPTDETVVEAARTAVAQIASPGAADEVAEAAAERLRTRAAQFAQEAAYDRMHTAAEKPDEYVPHSEAERAIVAGEVPIYHDADGQPDDERTAAARGYGYRAAAAEVAPPPCTAEDRTLHVPGGAGKKLYGVSGTIPDAVAGVLGSAAVARFQGLWEHVPTRRMENPALGLRPPAGLQGAKPSTWRRYACWLTGWEFWLPAHAPVPCLWHDHAYGDDAQGRDSVDVHPVFLDAGPEAVAQAAWRHVEGHVEALFSALSDLGEALTLAADVGDGSGLGPFEGETAYRPGYSDGGPNWRETSPYQT